MAMLLPYLMDEETCRIDPERQVETWKFDPSLKLSL